MGYHAIDGTPQQYLKENGGLASNYYLKFYEAGTSTAMTVASNETATDELGQASLLDKVRLNTLGVPVTPSGGAMVPHVNKAYKIVLYKNSDDADADNTSAAEWVIDKLSPALVSFTQSSGANDSALITYLASATATSTTVKTKLQEFVSVADYGAVGDGITDDTAAIATALLASLSVRFPAGIYLTSSVKVQRDYQNIHFDADVTLKAVANGDILFHQQKSFCRHSGHFTVDSNGKSGIYGMVVAQDDINSSSTAASQTDNRLPSITGDTGTETLVMLKCGPYDGADFSYLSRNRFPRINGGGAVTTVLLSSPPNNTADINTSNVFEHIDVPDTGTVNGGVVIYSGKSNVFQHVYVDGATSNGSPHGTASGIFVREVCVTTNALNDDNQFISGSIVNCNRDVENANDTTRFVSLVFNPSNSLFTNQPIFKVESDAPLRVYAGKFDATLTQFVTPADWPDPTSPSTNVVQVYHNLGHTNYTVNANTIGSDETYCHVYNVLTDRFFIKGRTIDGDPSFVNVSYTVTTYV